MDFGLSVLLTAFLTFSVSLAWIRHAIDLKTQQQTHVRLPTNGPGQSTRYHSCAHCQDLLIKFPPEWPNKVQNFRIRLPYTIAQVRKAAADGCPFFGDLCKGYPLPADRLYWHAEVLGSIFSPRWHVHNFTGCASWSERVVYFFRGLSSRPFHLYTSPQSIRFLYSAWRGFDFELTAEYDDPAARYIVKRPLSHEVHTSHTFDQARQWLQECIAGGASHSLCATERSSFVPTRLIEVRKHSDGSLNPRIYETKKDEVLAWSCLSYCWGGDQTCKTTQARLNDRLTSLPLEDLPATLQDALKVSHRIGIPFIWIDALCIVQDDPEDVAREITRMPGIYKYGLCTISASRSTSSTEGFLQAHETEPFDKKPIRLRTRCPNDEFGFIKLAYEGTEYRSGREPIHKRAWCFQERLLSPRTLDFERTQLRWECPSKIAVDGGRVQLAHATEKLIGKSLGGLTREQLGEAWQITVRSYTFRDITFGGDKLLAISAVASEYAPRLRDDYLAGLWRQSLPRQLGWFAGKPNKARHNSYIAPSWSWASIQGSVLFGNKDGKSSIQVIDCHVDLEHANAPFGSITGGYITLKGQVRDAVWFVNRSEMHIQIDNDFFVFNSDRTIVEANKGDGKTHFLAWFYADALVEQRTQDPNHSIKVHCLKLHERSEKSGIWGLFLLPVSNRRNVYERIGSFELGDARYRYDPPIERDFFENIEPKKIRIE